MNTQTANNKQPNTVHCIARLIAFYLPQFQPTPENDAWWGKGFTEWTNVTKAKPLFPDHYQPRLPADLGFYDLRVPETRAAQADMAREYGIEGFCYWHYWFEGRRILNQVVDSNLATGEPDFPFCLAWANHNWTRTWAGDEKAMLIEQTYSEKDDLNHIRYLARVFEDPRYIRVDGRPLFIVYAPTYIPNPQRTTDIWRSECVRLGIPEPFLLGCNMRSPSVDCHTLGFDGTIDLQPRLSILPLPYMDWGRKTRLKQFLAGGGLGKPDVLNVYSYEETVQTLLQNRPTDYPYYPSVFPDWDHTARRGRDGIVLRGSTPELFEKYLRQMVDEVSTQEPEHRLIFINAWNEWGEGMYLEPDQKFGHGFLEAVRRVMG